MQEELNELRNAERSLMRVLSRIGSRRMGQGYPGIRVYEALEETRAAIRVIEGDTKKPRRRSYDRLARH
jgi:hypothetical protein